jgi:hypothetical protein
VQQHAPAQRHHQRRLSGLRHRWDKHGSSPACSAASARFVVVMSLFFIMSMVAAYASRNLIFEQRPPPIITVDPGL